MASAHDATETQKLGLVRRLAGLEPNVRVPIDARGLGIALGVIAALVVAFSLLALYGVVNDWYEWLCVNTTGRPYTFIMREHVWILPSIAAGIVALLAFFLPRNYWARIVVLFTTFGVSFIAGHVFWGDSTTTGGCEVISAFAG